MLDVVVTGATGRMGLSILRAAAGDPTVRVVAATVRPGRPEVGSFAGKLVGHAELAAPVLETLEEALGLRPAVVIDFTSAASSAAHARACTAAGVPLVIGSTGLSPKERASVEEAATRIPIVLAPNTSVGVNVMVALATEAARKLGAGYDVEIFEAHHRHKKDAPSGTALQLARALSAVTGGGVQSSRLGLRVPGEIGVSAIRGGDVVGEHTVFFLGDGERVEITHRATSRDTFARGALRAAHWLVGQDPGLYGMEQVLGLSAPTPPG